MIKGYEEAAKADKLTNKMLKDNPINGKNVMEWMKYARTIKTTMDIILIECRKAINKNIKGLDESDFLGG